MPRSFDRRQITVDRNPLEGLNPEVGRLPKLVFDPQLFIQNLVQTIKLLTGIDLSSPQALVNSILDLLGLDKLQDKIEGVIAAIIAGFDEFFDGIFDLDGVFNTSASIQQALTNLSTLINEITANGGTGAKATENFTSYPDGALGAKWVSWLYGTGTATVRAVKGRMAMPNAGILTNRYGMVRYTALPTQTDYQKIGVAFGARPQSGLLNTAENFILGRVDAADTPASASYVFARLGNTGASIGYRSSGVDTTIKSLPGFRFNLSSSYWLECGVKGSNGQPDAPYTFRLWENNLPIFEAVDGAQLSPLGSGNRGVGVGFFNAGGLQSAGLASFAFYDNN